MILTKWREKKKSYPHLYKCIYLFILMRIQVFSHHSGMILQWGFEGEYCEAARLQLTSVSKHEGHGDHEAVCYSDLGVASLKAPLSIRQRANTSLTRILQRTSPRWRFPIDFAWLQNTPIAGSLNFESHSTDGEFLSRGSFFFKNKIYIFIFIYIYVCPSYLILRWRISNGFCLLFISRWYSHQFFSWVITDWPFSTGEHAP